MPRPPSLALSESGKDSPFPYRVLRDHDEVKTLDQSGLTSSQAHLWIWGFSDHVKTRKSSVTSQLYSSEIKILGPSIYFLVTFRRPQNGKILK